MPQVHYPRQIRQISKQGKELFEKLDPELREKYYGKFIAIEVDSGDYFIGETEMSVFRIAVNEQEMLTIFTEFEEEMKKRNNGG